MSLTSFSCASASAAMMIGLPRSRSASSTTRRRLMRSSCSATVFSTAMRSRITSAIARFSTSSSLSLAMRRQLGLALAGDRPRACRSFSTRSVSIAMTRSRFFSATSISRAWFSCWTPSCSSVRDAARSGPCSRSSACDPRGLGLLAGPHRLDLALLLDLGVGLPALQLEDRLAGVDVLPGDLLLLVALELVGAHVLDRGQLGDLPDALGVEDVASGRAGRAASARGSRSPRPRGCSRSGRCR